MTRKQIDTMREVRLWVRDIVVPVATAAITALTIPEVRQAVATKAESVKRSIEKKMKKEGERP